MGAAVSGIAGAPLAALGGRHDPGSSDDDCDEDDAGLVLTEEEIREGLAAEQQHEARKRAIAELLSHGLSTDDVVVVMHTLRLMRLPMTLRNCYAAMPHLALLAARPNTADPDATPTMHDLDAIDGDDDGPTDPRALDRLPSVWLLNEARRYARVQILAPFDGLPVPATPLRERLERLRATLRPRGRSLLGPPSGSSSTVVFDPSDPVESALEGILALTRAQLRKPLCVRFVGPDAVGADYGGVAREFLTRTADAIVDGLLPHIAFPGERCEGFPDANSTAAQADDGLVFYRGLGRLCGLCLRNPGWLLPLNLSVAFFRVVCGEAITCADLPSIDPDLDEQLARLAQLPLGQLADLHLVFAVERTVPDAHGSTQAELLPGGAGIAVTGTNVYDYYLARLAWRLGGGFRDLLVAFARGFHDAVPLTAVQGQFTPEELQRLVCGERDIPRRLFVDVDFVDDDGEEVSGDSDAARWRRAVPSTLYLQRAFKWCVEQLDATDLERLCRFVTGAHRVPFAGFPTRSGRMRVHFVPSLTDAHRPVAHTCTCQIDMPPYSSRDIMLARVREAIRTTGFQMM